MKSIILDRPLMKYYSVACRSGYVTFLCGESPGAHLIKNLIELNIPYSFLNIPPEHWFEYMKNDEYKGDR